MSSRAVYFVKGDCPAPYLVAIHGAIAAVNKLQHGKKKVDVVRFVELLARDSKGLYEAMVIATNRATLELFYEHAKTRNCADALEYVYPDYAHDRFHFDLRGDGRAEIWVAPNDSCVHITGDDVCTRPWNVRGYAPEGLIIKEIMFVGPNVAVRNAMRRYKNAKHEVRYSWRYQFPNDVTSGMTDSQWGKVAEALGSWGAMYLFTSEDTVIKVTRNRMEWVRPEKPKSRNYYTRMVHNGYECFPICHVFREYHHDSNGRRSPFEESVVTMALTHEVEARRR